MHNDVGLSWTAAGAHWMGGWVVGWLGGLVVVIACGHSF